jgi:hypothetical protein
VDRSTPSTHRCLVASPESVDAATGFPHLTGVKGAHGTAAAGPRWLIALPTVGMRGSSSGMSGVSRPQYLPSSSVGRSRCFQCCQSASIAESTMSRRVRAAIVGSKSSPAGRLRLGDHVAVMMASTRSVRHPLRRCWANTCVGGCCGGLSHSAFSAVDVTDVSAQAGIGSASGTPSRPCRRSPGWFA